MKREDKKYQIIFSLIKNIKKSSDKDSIEIVDTLTKIKKIDNFSKYLAKNDIRKGCYWEDFFLKWLEEIGDFEVDEKDDKVINELKGEMYDYITYLKDMSSYLDHDKYYQLSKGGDCDFENLGDDENVFESNFKDYYTKYLKKDVDKVINYLEKTKDHYNINN